MTYWDRVGTYLRQNGARRLTAQQRRRLGHKQNRAHQPLDPWAGVGEDTGSWGGCYIQAACAYRKPVTFQGGAR